MSLIVENIKKTEPISHFVYIDLSSTYFELTVFEITRVNIYRT